MDPVLEGWLNDRGIDGRILTLAGCEYEKGVLRFPRYSIDTGELLGWKCRDLDSGRFWGHPSGVSHSATRPLILNSDADSEIHSRGAMICEGESDTMRLAQSSLPNTYASDVICIPGATACPSEWMPILRKYSSVHVFADADTAGQQLPDRLAHLVPGVRVVRLPQSHDVCSFLLEHTEDDLRKLYDIAPIHVPKPGPIKTVGLVWDNAGSDEHRDKLIRVIVESGVVLRRAGGNEFKGLCPFHEERTPSFSVNSTKGLYRCFGCGAKGDVITFLKEHRGMEFGPAMRYLREYT